MAAQCKMDLKREFPLDQSICYLNHAAVAPWPLSTVEAIEAFARDNLQFGAKNYLHWIETEQALRNSCANLLNVASADIAFVKNTSEALSFIAYGIDWNPGDNVVLLDCEFPSNKIVWESLQARQVEVRSVPFESVEDIESRLLNACDARTRLLTVSSVQYGNGFRMDLEKLGLYCRQHQILFCVDAIQSLGALRFDAQQCHADFVAADGHKWLLAPEGIGLFYCRAEIRDQLTLHEYGWHMTDAPGNFAAPTWQIAADAKRFECGSPNSLGVHALTASLGLLTQVGLMEVEQQILAHTKYIMQQLHTLPNVEIVSSASTARLSGIVSFRLHDNTEALFQYLTKQGVICAFRQHAVRFSPHFYTPREVIDRAVHLVGEFISK